MPRSGEEGRFNFGIYKLREKGTKKTALEHIGCKGGDLRGVTISKR